jgi:branched-chain amino acid transport system substrate-binding protein
VASVAVVVSVLVLLSGCGTRASDSEIRAGVQPNGTVSLDQASVDELTAITQAAVAGGGAPAAVAGTKPGTTGTGPSTGSATPGATVPGSVGTQPRPAAGAAATPAPDTGRCTSSGAPVALGQVGTFSGLAGPIAGDGLAAMAVWAKDVNARGGLACHPVTIYVRDDGGDPARVAAAVKELLGRGVVAFIGNITALSQQGFKPEIDRNCTPAIGIDFGIDWSTDPCLFPQGGGWNESIAGLVEQAVERHHTKLGLLYCVEINTCSSIGKGIKAAADSHARLVGSVNSRLLPRHRTLATLGVRLSKQKELPAALPSIQIVTLDDIGLIEGEAEEVNSFAELANAMSEPLDTMSESLDEE